MSNTANTYKINPLSGDNYTAWWRCLKWILDDQELWEVTAGLETKLIPSKNNAITEGEKQAIADWRKKDKRVKKEICLRISDEYLVYIDQTMTVSELWTGLQSIFESKAAIGVVNLRREFFRTFTEDGTNMEEHVRKLHGLYQQLNA